MLGFSALSEQALGEAPSTAAGWVRPNPGAANFTFTGVAYTRPATSAADFAFAPDSYTAVGAVTLEISAAAVATHGVAGVGAVTLEITAAAVAEHQSIEVTGVGAVTLEITAAAVAAHGVAGAGAATLDVSADSSGGHGVAGAADAALSISAAAVGAHGVAGAGAVTLDIAAAAVAVHERYEVRGEVRLGGVLVNRRVRAHRRDTGALVGEGDTTAGRFSIHTGFAPIEHYIVPIHLDDAATDWSPPTANRVLSVLAQDV